MVSELEPHRRWEELIAEENEFAHDRDVYKVASSEKRGRRRE